MSDSAKITVNYFCLGAFFIFIGSVLLCALGFTVVLPFEVTRSWPEQTCVVVNSSFEPNVCSCDEQLNVFDTCVSKYPCLQIHVLYVPSGHGNGSALFEKFIRNQTGVDRGYDVSAADGRMNDVIGADGTENDVIRRRRGNDVSRTTKGKNDVIRTNEGRSDVSRTTDGKNDVRRTANGRNDVIRTTEERNDVRRTSGERGSDVSRTRRSAANKSARGVERTGYNDSSVVPLNRAEVDIAASSTLVTAQLQGSSSSSSSSSSTVFTTSTINLTGDLPEQSDQKSTLKTPDTGPPRRDSSAVVATPSDVRTSGLTSADDVISGEKPKRSSDAKPSGLTSADDVISGEKSKRSSDARTSGSTSAGDIISGEKSKRSSATEVDAAAIFQKFFQTSTSLPVNHHQPNSEFEVRRSTAEVKAVEDSGSSRTGTGSGSGIRTWTASYQGSVVRGRKQRAGSHFEASTDTRFQVENGGANGSSRFGMTSDPVIAILYRSWDDSFHHQCSLTECGDESWNVKEARRFKKDWGRIGQTFTCFYNPLRPDMVIIERTSLVAAVHAVLWPGICLVTGIALWIGLCLGCWSLGAESTCKEDYGPIY